MTLNEFVKHLKSVDDLDRLWELTLAFFKLRGAKQISYRHLSVDPERDKTPTLFVDGISEETRAKIVGHEHYHDNPFVVLALETTEPFYWSDLAMSDDFSEGERAFVEFAREMLPGDGVIIQVFGPKGQNGTVNLGFGEGARRLFREELKQLQIVAQVAHLRYCKLVSLDDGEGEVSMTARELEVLRWIAKGKSNSVIADILGISIHTVDTHVRRIFRKLDVNDRTTAAVKGLGAGLVQHAA